MALTKFGYKRETYEDILKRLETKAKSLFGSDANVSQRSALGFVLRVMAWGLSLVWQDNEAVYYSAYRHTAEGAHLDNLLPYAGTTRNPAVAATGEVLIRGQPNTRVSLGTILKKDDDTLYHTIEEKYIPASGEVLIEVMAEEPGASGNADIGEINALLYTVQGIESVSNLVAITNGRERESDVDVRKRSDLTTEGQGSATAASIHAELMKIPDVRAVYVDVNETGETNRFNTPLRAIQPFVLGGSEQEITEAVLRKKAAGIQSYGRIVHEVADVSGNTHQIGFTRSSIVQVYMRVRLTTDEYFEADGHAQVRTALVKVVGGIDADSVVYTGLPMGSDVVLSRLTAAVYQVNGILDVQIELSTDNETFVTTNLVMDKPDIAQTSANAIEVMS